MSDPKHAKISTYEQAADGTIKRTTKSYFDYLASIKEERIDKVKTSRENLLKDVVSCLDVIAQQKTKELTLTILSDEFNQPTRIIKTYTISKEEFKRR